MDTESAQRPLSGLDVLISGAGIAGPALAWWLGAYGARTTVVEVAPALRTSGFRVDFRGPTQLGVLAEMGVLVEVRRHATGGGAMRWVDAQGREVFELPAEFAGGDVEIHRADLSRLLVERSRPQATYRFGDAVTGLEQRREGVEVTFRHGGPERFDLVVAADGIHSGVRRLAFGPEASYVQPLGYAIAGWDLPNPGGLTTTPDHYNEPGRMISAGVDVRDPEGALAQVIFRADRIEVGWHDLAAQRAFIRQAMRGMGWRAPELLTTLDGADDVYFDAISRVRVPRWSADRVVLLGDAAGGVTLGGMGVGLGVVGARVLAGELARAAGDHRRAFAAYESALRSRLARWQGGASPGAFLAPPTRLRLGLRDTMFRSALMRRLLVSSTRSLATDPGLPAYAR